MGLKVRLFLFILLIAASHNIHAFDVEITGKMAETSLRFEHNRNFNFIFELSALGELEVNSSYNIRSGFSLGRVAENANVKTFTSLNAYPFPKVPVIFSLLWNYSGLTDYNVHSNSIVPIIIFDMHLFDFSFGTSFGLNYQFTSFFGERSIFEWAPVYSFFIFFIDTDFIRTGLVLGNYNEFIIRTLSDYTLTYVFDISINRSFRLINEIELMQSGGAFLTNTFYGIIFKTGVRYLW